MAAASEEELKLSRRFKEHLEGDIFRKHLRNYLEKYEKDTKLKILDAYEQLSGGEIGNWIKNVDGLEYNPNAKDKRLDLLEQCYLELEMGINKTDFIKYLKSNKYLNV